MSDLTRRSAADLASALVDGEVSAVEVTQAHLDRIAAVDEAVFALSDSRPGLEEMYFLIQEEILKPRYQFDISPRADLASIPDPRAC